MENQNLNQYENRQGNEIKIGTTRDGRSLTFKVQGDDRIFFKPVAYLEKVIETAKKRQAGVVANVESIKG